MRPSTGCISVCMAAAVGCAPVRGAPRRAPHAPDPIVLLLDLNYTLVESREGGAREGRGAPGRRIARERYREWLLDLVKGRTVILITARPDSQKEQTLSRIRSATGWQPDEAYFNEKNLPPPECKRDILDRHVFPKYGAPGAGTVYIALESNPRTAAMYASLGIPGMRVWEPGQFHPEARGARRSRPGRGSAMRGAAQ